MEKEKPKPVVGTIVPSVPFKPVSSSPVSQMASNSNTSNQAITDADLLRAELTKEVSHAERIRAIKESVRRSASSESYSFY